MTPDDERTEALLADLHAHLAATAELPVRREVSPWLGEAEAVAADVADGDAPEAAVRKRVGQVRDLLADVEATGHDDADDHVAAAKRLADELAAAYGVEE